MKPTSGNFFTYNRTNLTKKQKQSIAFVHVQSEEEDGLHNQKTYNSESSSRWLLYSFPKWYLDISYFLCITPFRLKLTRGEDDNLPHFVVRRWWPQVIGCFVFYILTVLFLIFYIRSSNLGDMNDPSLYFKLIYKLVLFVSILYNMKQLCLDCEQYARVLNFLFYSKRNGLPVPEKKTSFKIWATVALISTLYVLNGVTMWLEIRIPFSSTTAQRLSNATMTTSKTWAEWWGQQVQMGRMMLFLSETDSSVAESVLGVAFLLPMIYGNFFLFLENVWSLIVAVTLWIPIRSMIRSRRLHEEYGMDMSSGCFVYEFQKVVDKNEASPTPSWKNIVREYESAKRLAKLLNQVVSARLAFYFLRSMITNAFKLDDARDWKAVIDTMILYFFSFTVLLLGADSAFKVLLSLAVNDYIIKCEICGGNLRLFLKFKGQ